MYYIFISRKKAIQKLEARCSMLLTTLLALGDIILDEESLRAFAGFSKLPRARGIAFYTRQVGPASGVARLL